MAIVKTAGSRFPVVFLMLFKFPQVVLALKLW